MNAEEQDELSSYRPETPLLYAAQVSNGGNRTLLYGFTCLREAFHVYLQRGAIIKVIYRGDSLIYWKDYGSFAPMHELIPDKRLYPEGCDAETCKQLVSNGISLPFTTRGCMADPFGKAFVGLTMSDLLK